MTTDTNTMISITEANQNFSKEIADKKQTIDFSTITACGECCIACPKKQAGICKGCIEADGYVPEWKESGRCKVHECTRQHNVPFCGICDEFPCEQLTSIIHWNPNIEEHMDMLAKEYFKQKNRLS